MCGEPFSILGGAHGDKREFTIKKGKKRHRWLRKDCLEKEKKTGKHDTK